MEQSKKTKPKANYGLINLFHRTHVSMNSMYACGRIKSECAREKEKEGRVGKERTFAGKNIYFEMKTTEEK